MSNEIDHNRRRLVGAAALTFVASQFAFQRQSRSPAVRAQAGKSGADQAGYAHIVRAAEADRRRRAQYRLCRSRSGGRTAR